MNFIQLVKLLLRNWKMLLLVPVVMAVTIWYFTRHQKKVFSSDTVVYTGIASGYSLNGDNRADYFATSNAFDNLLSIINSRETKEEVVLSLLASNLQTEKHDPEIMGWDAFAELQELIPQEVRRTLVKGSVEETRKALTRYMQTSENNLVYNIINGDNPYYSLKALQNIQSLRINSSDLIKVTYETNDAAICKHTLEYLVDIFMKKHRLLREGQTSSVIAYFEREVRAAFRRLDSCEQIFLTFNKQNDIINYYEQTKAVAGEKENLYSLNHNLEMERNASEKAVAKVNDDLKGRIYQDLYGSEMINDREKLAEVYGKIAIMEAMGNGGDGARRQTLDSLQRVSANLENHMRQTVQKLSTQYNLPKGIPVKNVLDEWVKSTLSFEQSKARLTIMDKRKKEFAEEYRKFAPLGAMLKKIERQITVAEQEYLELLHGLNLARLTQQNNELTSKLTIVDPPYLPLKPNPSKRMLLVIAGGFAGFVIVLGFLLGNFLLNRTLQQPLKALKKIGAPLLGIYPVNHASGAFMQKANLRVMQQLLARLNLHQKPVVLGIISTQHGEGKSEIVNSWQAGLQHLNYKVHRVDYKPGSAFLPPHDGDFVLVEFPPLDNTILIPGQVPALDKAVLVCRANRIWTKIDDSLLDSFRKTSGHEPLLVLNGVDIDHAEDFIGEVPKQRSMLRAFLKSMVRMEFGNRKLISKRK